MSKKSLEVKKNHHYVWAQHLKRWATGNDIHYINRRGTIGADSIRGLSREKGFYKISALTSEDITYLKRWSSLSPKHLQKTHSSFLDAFAQASKLINIPKNKENLEELKNISEVAQYNTLENIHGQIERAAAPIIKMLCNEQPQCLLKSKNLATFCTYIGHQLARTKTVKVGSFSAIRNYKNDDPAWRKAQELLEKNWWFISFIAGINLGYSLWTDDDRHIFIINDSGTPFITSDKPVINIHDCIKTTPENASPKYSDIYYPLSPRIAYMINNSDKYNHLSRHITEKEVIDLNIQMAMHSDEIIYGSTKEVLLDTKKRLKKTTA